MKKFLFISLIAVIIIAVLAIAGFFVYRFLSPSHCEKCGANQTADVPVQSSQATEGWKTYTNSEYGFEIKYPQNMSFNEDQTGIRFFSTELYKKEGGDAYYPTIYISEDKVKTSVKDFINTVFADLKNGSIKETIINNYKVWQFTTDFNDVERKGVFTFFQNKPDVTVEVSYNSYNTYDVNTNNTYEGIYNQMLSTFKFTTSSGITADQQLRINGTDYNFIFTNDSVKVYNQGNNFLQEINIGKDAMETAKFDLINYNHQIITVNDDVNYDGYKDLAIEIGNGYGGVNFFYNFYYFNPTTKKFVEVPELKNVCNPNVKYEQKEILSSCKNGPSYTETIYQWGAAGYIKIVK